MDNNQFNNFNNVVENNSYENSNLINEAPINNPGNPGNPNNSKKTLGILLGVCVVGIIILAIVFIGFISPKDEDSKDVNLSPEAEEEHINQIYKAINLYITSTTFAINDMRFGPLTGNDTIYYIPVSTNENDTCIELPEETINPFGENGLTYVGVVYREEYYAYDYYFTFYDEFGYGMKLTKSNNISKNIIKKTDEVNKGNIKTQYADETTNIVVLETPRENPNSSCKIK